MKYRTPCIYNANNTDIQNKVAEEASNVENNVSVEDKLEEPVDFPCTFCDFRSNWANGVKIHIGRKHVDMVQLDGNDSLSEASEEDEKYLSVENYLKTGWLGSAYQRFLDAMNIIDECSLQVDMKTDERGKVLEARKCAIGPNYRGFPPWDSS